MEGMCRWTLGGFVGVLFFEGLVGSYTVAEGKGRWMIGNA